MNQLTFLLTSKPHPLPYTAEELADETRFCPSCDQNKHPSEFYLKRYAKNGNPIYRNICKDCWLERQRAAQRVKK